MKINIEKEYKLLVSKAEFYKLLAMYPNAVFKTQINTYYDTEFNDIRNAKGACRIRQMDNGIYIFTLKMHSNKGLLEFEKNVTGNDSSIFLDEEIVRILKDYDINGPVHKIASLRTKRAVIVSEDAELCFDINEYNGHHDFEIEYEYKREHDGLLVFNNILSTISQKYKENCDSKIKRALDSL